MTDINLFLLSFKQVFDDFHFQVDVYENLRSVKTTVNSGSVVLAMCWAFLSVHTWTVQQMFNK